MQSGLDNTVEKGVTIVGFGGVNKPWDRKNITNLVGILVICLKGQCKKSTENGNRYECSL